MTTTRLTTEDITAFEPEAKVGLLATVSPEGLPHLSLITSLQAKSPTELMWGQFCEGRSKEHVQQNPHTGFVVMSLDRRQWRGKARWTRSAREGDDYVHYNHLPMFRYNSYFGIHTVHYMDLVELSERGGLALPRVIAGSLASALARPLAAAAARTERILKPWAEAHLTKPSTLKFLSYVDADGYPAILPVLPCQAADSRRLVIVPTVYADELASLELGTSVAVFGLNLEMESVLVRGTLGRFRSGLGRWFYTVDLDWVYNTMPPVPGPVYPPEPLRPVTSF